MLGLTTCYDMRFPEVYTLLRQKGAQVLLAPSAFTVPTGRAHWEVLLRARAIENQCFVLAAAQVGHHNAKRKSWGHSLIVDPWGEILADARGFDDLPTTNASAEAPGAAGADAAAADASLSPEENPLLAPCIVTARLDLEKLRGIREKMPIDKHRRGDLFILKDATSPAGSAAAGV